MSLNRLISDFENILQRKKLQLFFKSTPRYTNVVMSQIIHFVFGICVRVDFLMIKITNK